MTPPTGAQMALRPPASPDLRNDVRFQKLIGELATVQQVGSGIARSELQPPLINA